MNDEVGYAIDISIRLFVYGSLIAIVAVFSLFSFSIYNKSIAQSESQYILQEKSKFYVYYNKIVSGSDIVDVISQNARLYTFVIDFGNRKFEVSSAKEFEPKSQSNTDILWGKEIWTIDFLSDLMGEDIQGNFMSTIEYENSGIKQFSFIKE